jgi:hypothetical protein
LPWNLGPKKPKLHPMVQREEQDPDRLGFRFQNVLDGVGIPGKE